MKAYQRLDLAHSLIQRLIGAVEQGNEDAKLQAHEELTELIASLARDVALLERACRVTRGAPGAAPGTTEER